MTSNVDVAAAGRLVAARLDRMLLRLADKDEPEGWYLNARERRLKMVEVDAVLGMSDRVDERVVDTGYGFDWGWFSRSGKRVWFRVTRLAHIDGRGAVIGIDAGDPGKGPRLQVALSDGGRKVRVWLDDVVLGEVAVA